MNHSIKVISFFLIAMLSTVIILKNKNDAYFIEK